MSTLSISVTNISKKVQKYELQCDLIRAIFSLTKPYWKPEKANRFFQKWPVDHSLLSIFDKHLRHGFNLFLQLLSENKMDSLLTQKTSEFCNQMREQISIRNLFLANEAGKVSAILLKAGIPAILLKGLSYYAMSERFYFQSRFSSDIDLLIEKKNLKRALQILKTGGYQLSLTDTLLYQTEEEREDNYYEYTLRKPCGTLVSEIGLHWTLPTGRMLTEKKFDVLPESRIQSLFQNQNQTTIAWQNHSIRILDPKNLLIHFFLNVRRDHMGQINIARWLLAAKDLSELILLLNSFSLKDILISEDSNLQKMAEELTFISKIFSGGETSCFGSTDELIYKSLISWIPKKRHAHEVKLALFLSNSNLLLFRALAYIHACINSGIKK